ncbi:hypothetical protein ACJQWK_02257 [Exserohilum turcicum]
MAVAVAATATVILPLGATPLASKPCPWTALMPGPRGPFLLSTSSKAFLWTAQGPAINRLSAHPPTHPAIHPSHPSPMATSTPRGAEGNRQPAPGHPGSC